MSLQVPAAAAAASLPPDALNTQLAQATPPPAAPNTRLAQATPSGPITPLELGTPAAETNGGGNEMVKNAESTNALGRQILAAMLLIQGPPSGRNTPVHQHPPSGRNTPAYQHPPSGGHTPVHQHPQCLHQDPQCLTASRS